MLRELHAPFKILHCIRASHRWGPRAIGKGFRNTPKLISGEIFLYDMNIDPILRKLIIFVVELLFIVHIGSFWLIAIHLSDCHVACLLVARVIVKSQIGCHVCGPSLRAPLLACLRGLNRWTFVDNLNQIKST